jgi:uncharacterized protein
MSTDHPKMEIDLGHVSERAKFDFKESFEISETELGRYGCEVAVEATLTSMGNRYLLDARIDCSLSGQCSRCLEECVHPVSTGVQMVFQREGFSGEVPSGISENDFVILTADEEYCYDIFPRIMEAVILEVPIKVLCSEDCRGLCPVCRVNLNRHQCDCASTSIDPRWEPLKKVFK